MWDDRSRVLLLAPELTRLGLTAVAARVSSTHDRAAFPLLRAVAKIVHMHPEGFLRLRLVSKPATSMQFRFASDLCSHTRGSFWLIRLPHSASETHGASLLLPFGVRSRIVKDHSQDDPSDYFFHALPRRFLNREELKSGANVGDREELLTVVSLFREQNNSSKGVTQRMDAVSDGRARISLRKKRAPVMRKPQLFVRTKIMFKGLVVPHVMLI